MKNKFTYQILVDNKPHSSGVFYEHGLAIWLEVFGYKVLFDTGASELIVKNSRHLEVPLESCDMVILSHGHYDHTGGFGYLDHIIPQDCKIYAHPDIRITRYSRHKDGSIHEIGMPESSRMVLKKRSNHVVWCEGHTEIIPGLWLTGPVLRETPYENTGGDFWLDPGCTEHDLIEDDLSLVIDDMELHLFAGCAHSGIVNVLNHVIKMFPQKKIGSVVGGLHLKNSTAERRNKTMHFLDACGINRIEMLHCSN